MVRFFEQNWHNLLLSAVLLAVAVAISLVTHSVVFWVLRSFAGHEETSFDQSLIRHGEKVSLVGLPAPCCLGCLARSPAPTDPDGGARAHHRSWVNFRHGRARSADHCVTGRFACWALPRRYRPHPSRAAVKNRVC